MRVTGNPGAWPSPYSMSKSRRTESGPGWEKYLDVEAQKRKMRALPEGEGLPSVWMQFHDDYRVWKARQPELVLLESQGWTEENLDFLREQYSGELTAFEVYDALETMKAMGAISRKEENYATGNLCIQIDISELDGYLEYADTNARDFWLGSFHKAPVVNFHTLDDILSWVGAFRTEDHPDALTRAEAVARGWI